MKGAFARHASRIGPAFERFTHRVGVTMALLAKRRRSEDDGAPRRTTAPAPGGGLHATGRRVVRGEAGARADATTPPGKRGPLDPEPISTPKPRASKRFLAAGAAVMVGSPAGAVVIKKSQHPAAAPEAAAPLAPA